MDSSLSKTQDKALIDGTDKKSRVGAMNLQHNLGSQKEDTGYVDGRHNPYSRGRFDNRVHENGLVAQANRDFPNFFPYEGSSSYVPGFSHDFVEHKRVLCGSNQFDRVKNLERDRAELLRKLDELKIQLGGSSDGREKSRETVPINRMMDSHMYGHNSYIPEVGSTSLYRVDAQHSVTDQNVVDPVYRNYNHGHASNVGNIYHSRSVPHEFARCEGSYSPNRVVRSSYQQTYHDQFLGHHIGFNPKIFASYGPQCSCVQCYRNWQVQSRIHQRANHAQLYPINPMQHKHLSSGTYRLHGHNLDSRDFDFNSRGFDRGIVRRVVIAHGSERVCHPRAGGAPFLSCPSCFQLLKLPKRIAGKNQQKLQCGACSELISVDLEKRGIVIIIRKQLKQVSTEGDVLDDVLKDEGCDNFTTTLQSTNIGTNSLSTDDSVKSSQYGDRRGSVSSSPGFSEVESSPDNVIIPRENSMPADPTLKDDSPVREDSEPADLASIDDSPPPLPHSPLEVEAARNDDFADFVFSRCGMGNKSKRTSQQNFVKDVQIRMEKEVAYGDVAVYKEVSYEEDQLRTNKDDESLFSGLFKKSLKDILRSSQSAEMDRINVFVNGEPLSNRVVKKAEKLAGPIHPGDYWYDYRAGFWGVMGQPCQGIIPPFIKEFNFPMPTNCGAGNTGVFVNGRELHENDLDLLASRGLPIIRDKFYMIEISGRVVDECSGEELDDLGMLAPTVEKVKHGFGMRPRAIVE